MTLGELRKLTEGYPDDIEIVLADGYANYATAFEFVYDWLKKMPKVGIRMRNADDEMGISPWQKVLKELDNKNE